MSLGVHKLTGRFVAIKSINKQFFSDENSKNKVMKEVNILKQLRHQSVIRLFETFESDKHILFVIELCTGGDLLNYVRKRRKLKENVAKHAFKQILDGLFHCHTKSILHRISSSITYCSILMEILRYIYNIYIYWIDMRLWSEQGGAKRSANDRAMWDAGIYSTRNIAR